MKFQGGAFVALLICLYATLSPPFVFSAFIPFLARAGLELGSLITIATYLLVIVKHPLPYRAVGAWLMLCALMFLNSNNEISAAVASAINIVIFILIIKAGNDSDSFIDWLRWYWLRIWSLASISIIIAFAAYQLDLITFSPFDLGEVVGKDSYNYYNNFFLGNLVKYNFFDYSVPKLSWYIFEPGMLSFYLGVNVIIAEKVCARNNAIISFRVINLIAGFLTFSTTFYSFFAIYAASKVIMFRPLRKIRLLLIPLLVVIISWLIFEFFIVSDLADFTSVGDRSLRFEIARTILNNNSIYSFLFGNGIGISGVVSDRGISAGFLSILIERGFLIMLFLMVLIYKFTTPSWLLLMYIVFYHFTFELIWYPLFYIAIALNFSPVNDACSSKEAVSIGT